jgi:hypothetical protein
MESLSNSTYAPIAVFCFKRLANLQKLVEALLANPEAAYSDIYFYSDAARSEHDFSQVQAVRKYLKEIQGFRKIVIIERESNFGLANSFITGISEILSTYENGIFLEDDNFVSSGFLSFMNSSLEHFKYENQVGCISGFSYPMFLPNKEGYFLHGAETWSMATWRYVWQEFEPETKTLLEFFENRRMQKKLNMYGFNFHQMLLQQMNGEIDSWGVRWWASAVAKDYLCYYPPKPYCVNEGWGEEGTHVVEQNPIMSKAKYLSENRDPRYPTKIKSTLFVTLNMRAMNLKNEYRRLLKAILHKIRNWV